MLTYVVLAAFVVGILSGPVQWSGETCSIAGECPASQKFSYVAGNVYKYSYAAAMRTSIPGSMVADVATMRVTAEVNVHVLSACEFVATLAGVKIVDGASMAPMVGGEKFAAALEAFPVRFSYANGKVVHVCPAAADPVWAVNMKRGIISSLQNTMPVLSVDHSAVEVDVAGNCPVTYEVLGGGRIRKVKDILACEGRHSINSIIKGMPYKSQSSIKSLPLMKTGHQCVQTIAANVIAAVKCTEVHILRPFSADSTGAVTEIDYSMTLVGQGRGAIKAPAFARRHSMLFEHSAAAGAAGAAMKLEEVKTMIAKLCAQPEIIAASPEIFSRLVEDLRALGVEDIFTLATVPICPRSVLPLAEAMPTSRIMIGVSALVNNFCSQSALIDCSGKHHAIIKPVLDLIVATLGQDCSAAAPAAAFIAIKAVTNIGHAAREATQVLTSCAWNSKLPMKMRVAAIRAFQRFPCAAIKASNLVEVMRDIRSDAELRIAAYSVLMICPDARLIDVVHTMLKGEATNQVGSYIWTHLTNLKESSSRVSSVARELLANVELQKSFNMDKRKFSRNVEWSTYHKGANVGGRFEADVIFSAKSFIPRSGKIALDADVFGQNIELFQMDGRIEGMEDVLQEMLAPETMASARKDLIGEAGARASAFSKASASWEMRMLGNTYGYGEVTGADVLAAKAKINFIEILMAMAKNQKVDVLKNVKFIDSAFTIPTIVGLPLRMRVEGIVSISMALDGKVDLRQMMASPRAVDINGIVTPSAAVNVKATMTLDAEFARTGLQLDCTLHTSTATKARIEIKEGEVFNMDFALPKQKINLISFETRFNVIEKNAIRAAVVAPAAAAAAGAHIAIDTCWASKIMGLEACMAVAMPKPFANAGGAWFPFSGPAKFMVYVNKIDTIASYHVEVRHVPTQANGVQIFKAVMSTPGGQFDREWSAVIWMNAARRMVKMDVHTPYMAVNVNALVMNSAARKRLQIEATTSAGSKYVVYADTPISMTSAGSTMMKPVVRVVWDNMALATLDGSIEWLKEQMFIAKLRLRNVTPQPIIALVSLINEGGNVKTEIDFQCSIAKAKLSGMLSKKVATKGEIVQVLRLAGGVALWDWASRAFEVESSIITRHTAGRQHFIVNSRWSTDLWANKYDGKSQVEFAYTKTQWITNVYAGFDKFHSIAYNQVFVWSMNPAALKKTFAGKFKIKAPFMKLDQAGEVQQTFVNGRVLTVKAAWNSGTVEYLAHSVFDVKSITPLRVAIKGGVRFPGRDIKFSTSFAQVSPSSYKQIGSIELAPEMVIKFTSAIDTKPGKHQFAITIETSEMAPWIVKVGLVTVLPTLAVEASATYGDVVVYGFEGKILSRGMLWVSMERSLKFDLVTPGRHFSSEFGVVLSEAVMAIITEARWAPTKVLSIRAKVLTSVPMIDALVLIPGTRMHLKAALKESQMRILFDTSIRGWEHSEITGMYAMAGRGEVMVKGEIACSALPAKVTYDLSFKAAALQTWITLSVKTPFIGYAVNTVSLTWKKEFTGMMVVRAESNIAGNIAVVNGEYMNAKGSLVAKARIQSPWAFAEAISVVIEHTALANQQNSLVEVSFAPMQVFRLRLYTKFGERISEFAHMKLSIDIPFDRTHSIQIAGTHKFAGNALSTSAEVFYQDASLFGIVSELKMINGYYGVGEFTHDATVRIINVTPIVWAIVYKKAADKLIYVVNLDYGHVWALDTKFIRIADSWKSFRMAVLLETPMAFMVRHVYTGTVMLAGVSESKVDVAMKMVPGGDVAVKGILISQAGIWRLTGDVIIPVFQKLNLVAEFKPRSVWVSLASARRDWLVTAKVNAEGGMFSSMGELVVVTPLAQLAAVRGKWMHLARNGDMDIDFDLSVDAPVFGLSRTGLIWKHKNAGFRVMSNHVTVTLLEGKKIAFTSEWNLRLSAATVHIKMVTPFAPLRTVVIATTFTKLAAGIAFRHEIAINGKTTALDISANIAAKKAIAIKLATPSAHLPSLELLASIEAMAGATEIVGQVIWSPTGIISVATKYELTNERVFISHAVATPWAIAKATSIEFTMSGPIASCNIDCKLAHNLWASPVVFHSDITSGGSGNFEVNINARTPLAYPRSIDVVVRNSFNVNSRYAFAVELRLPGYSGSVVNEMLINSNTHFQTKTHLEYALYSEIKSLTFETALRFVPSKIMKATVGLRSTWAPISHMSLAIDHVQAGANVFASSAKLIYGPEVQVIANFELTEAVHLKLSLERVHKAWAPLYLRVEHSVLGAALFKNFIAAQWAANEIWQVSTIKEDRAGELVIKASALTPLAGFRTIHASINHKIVASVSKCAIAVVLPAGKYQIACDVAFAGPALRLVLVGETPHAAIRTCRLELSHHLARAGPVADEIKFTLNGKLFTAKSEFTLTGDEMNAKIVTKLPEEYSVSFDHAVPAGSKAFTTSGQMKIHGFAPISVSVNKAGTWASNYDNSATMQFGAKKVAISSQYTGTASASAHKVTLVIPEVGYIKGGLYGGQLKRSNAYGIDDTITLKTPYSQNGQYKMNLKSRSTGNAVSRTISLKTPLQNYNNWEASLIHEGTASNLKSKINIKTPLPSVSSVSATVDHAMTGAMATVSSRATGELNGKIIELTINMKLAAVNKAMLVIRTPFAWLREGSLTCIHTSDPTKEGSISVSRNHAEAFRMVYNVASISKTMFEIAVPSVLVAKWNVNIPAAGPAAVNVGATYFASDRVSREWKIEATVAGLMKHGESVKAIVVAVTVPKRVVKLEMSIGASRSSFSNSAVLAWARGAESRIAYTLSASRAISRRSEIIVKALFTVEVGAISRGVNVMHRIIPTRSHTTEVRIINGAADSWVVSNVMRIFADSFENVLSVAHPSLARTNVITIAAKNAAAMATIEVAAVWAKAEKFVFSGAVKKIIRANLFMDLMFNIRVQHPASRLDTMFEVDFVNSAEKATVGCVAKYMMFETKAISVFSYRTTVDKITPAFVYAISYPGAVVSVDVRKVASPAGKIVYLAVANVFEHAVKASATIDVARRTVTVLVDYPMGVSVRLVASSANLANVNVEMAWRASAVAAFERFINVGLMVDSSNKLRVVSFVKPGIGKQIKSYYSKIYVSDKLVATIDATRAWMVKDIALRSAALVKLNLPIVAVIGTSVNRMERDMIVMSAAVKKAYFGNEFFSKDIVAAIAAAGPLMRSTAWATSKNAVILYSGFKSAMARAGAAAGPALNAAVASAGNFVVSIIGLTSDLIAWTADVVEAVVPMWTSMNERTVEWFNVIAGKFVGIVTKWLANPAVNSILRRALEFDWQKTFVTPVVRVLFSVHRSITEVIDVWVGWISKVANLWMAIADWPVVRFAWGIADNVFANILSAYEILSIREHVVSYTWAISREVIALLFDTVADAMSVGQSGWTRYNAMTGSAEFIVFMPFKVADFVSFPKASTSFISRMSEIKNNVMGPLSSSEWSVSDAFYSYKPNHDVSKWLPPFAAKAMISGDSDYMTFDGKHFVFSGACSYLLTKDSEGLFEVFVNYEKRGGAAVRKSISVVSGMSEVEVTAAGKVVVKGSGAVELPATVGAISIKRVANIIRVEIGKGLKIEWELVHNWCTIEVSGWKYGKLSGILGTYDNEPSTDMVKRVGAVATGAHFAHSWARGPCFSRTNFAAEDASAVVSASATAMCELYFSMSADAHFRRCSRIVNPAPFMKMCVKMVSYNMVPAESDICSIAAIYKRQCSDAGVPVGMPAACSQCRKASGFVKSGESVEISIAKGSVPRQADVIFVVEHAACNENVRKNLGDLVSQMSSSLAARGVDDIKFGVVGFGGLGINGPVHAKTINGKITTSGIELIRAASGWDMRSGPAAIVDTMSAVEFAANIFHFRIGAGKSIVLLACSACHEKATTFSDVRRAVVAQDIHVSVVAPGNVRLEKKSAYAPYIMGADASALYTHKFLTTQSGNRVLRASAIMPRDLCVAMAMESDGAYFNALHLNGARRQAKSFVAVAAQVLAKKAVPSPCQVCSCVTTAIGTGQSICRSCGAPSADIFTYQPSYM